MQKLKIWNCLKEKTKKSELKKLGKRTWLAIGVDLLIILLVFLIGTSSPGRLVATSLFLVFHILLLFVVQQRLTASLLFLLLVLPYHVTFSIPIDLLPFEPYVRGVLVNYLVPSVSILDVGVCLLLLNFMLSGIWKYVYVTQTWIIVCSLLYFVFHNLYFADWVTLFSSFRLLIYFIAFLLTTTYIKKSLNQKVRIGGPVIKSVIGVVLFSLVLQGAIGMLQVVKGSSIGLGFLGESQVVIGVLGSSFVDINGDLAMRAYGTFPHPNVFAGYLLFLILLLLYFYREIVNDRLRAYGTLIMGGILFAFLAMLLTLSRLHIGVSLVLLVVVTAKRFLKPLVSKNVPITILTPVSNLYERFSNLLIAGDHSIIDRVNLIKMSEEIIGKNLMLGTGTGRFISAMGENIPTTVNGLLLLQPVHNIYLLLLVEHGVIFGGLIIIGLVLYLISCLKTSSNRLFSILVIISLIVISLFDHYLITLSPGITLFFGILLLLYIQRYKFKIVESF